MFIQNLQQFWTDTLFCLFIANPFCSDDAVGYHIYNSLNKNEVPDSLRIFYSYNISVEEILLALENYDGKKQVLLVDAIFQEEPNEPILVNTMGYSSISTHKMEWPIIEQYCMKQGIALAALLLPVDNIEYTGEITPLSHRLNEYKDALVNFFLSK
ncbi:MAG: hypothetical protein INQ03_05955 [Candidatus Heimdallarchaeota archaeon]|nr:hypothetical protein [Candidatus Heimdallarchaeota archaeon]